MNYRQALKAARAACAEINLQRNVTLQSIQHDIELSRRRPIVIAEIPGMSGQDVCGLWLQTAGEELIVHAKVRSELHRQQIILHEFSHMILHHDLQGPDTDYAADLLPGLDSRLVLRALGRSSYGSQAEFRAEVLADHLANAIVHSSADQLTEPLAFGEVFG